MALGLGYFLQAFTGARPLRDLAWLVRAEAQRALALNPSDPQPHFLLGSVAAAQDYDWNEAAVRFRDAMKATHVSADARWAYATIYLGAFGRFEESAAEWNAPSARSVECRVARRVGPASDQRRSARPRDEEALKAIELDERHFGPHLILGGAYLASGRLEQALAAFQRAHRAAPGHTLPLGLLAGSARPARRQGPGGGVDRADGRRTLPGLGTGALSPGLW